MPKQVHAGCPPTHTNRVHPDETHRQEMAALAEADAAAAERARMAATDELLDEIDLILEENSWVGCYLQRGGE